MKTAEVERYGSALNLFYPVEWWFAKLPARSIRALLIVEI